MNPETVYFKTESGMHEVKTRALGLRAELRRLLILVDGNASLSRLAVFVRGSEIAALIAELENQGLVTTGMSASFVPGQRMAAPGLAPTMPLASDGVASVAHSSPTAPVTYANLEPTTAQMQAVRRTAIRALIDLLGPDAEVLQVKIDRCKDAQELRVAITEIRQTLDRRLGPDTGQRFLDSVRAAAEETR